MQPVNYIFIDYENVQPNLAAITNLSFVRVITFVGANQKHIPFEFADAMQRLGNRAMYVKIGASGTNALDFHIAFYLGILVKRGANAYFHIVSNDTGFDPLIQHLREKRLKVYRSASIDDLPFLRKNTAANDQPLIPAVADAPESSSLLTANGAKPSLDELYKVVIERLKYHTPSRPSTLDKLRNHLPSLTKQQLTAAETEALTTMLFNNHLISLEEGASQRLRYHL
ncbi:MAG: PIN domain-containing protein [Chloroflexus sp.]